MLSFAPVALPVCSGRLGSAAPDRPAHATGGRGREPGLQPWRVEVPIASGAIATGRRAADIGIERTQEYRLRAIMRHGELVPAAEALEAGDRLVFAASEVGVKTLWESPRFGLSPQHLYAVSVGPGEHGTLLEFGGRRPPGHRRADGQAAGRHHRHTRSHGLRDLLEHRGSGPPRGLHSVGAGRWSRASTRQDLDSAGVLAAVVVAASFGLAPVELIAFAGAVLMVLTRVLTPRSAVRALDWNVLFILAGRWGSVRSSSKRVGRRPGSSIEQLSAGSMPVVVVVFAVTTTIMTNLITNAAAASILTPVALGIATKLGLDPVTLLALVATCISFTFINPFSHQTNLMVMGPGGYSTRTFAKFGAPLVAVSLATSERGHVGAAQLRLVLLAPEKVVAAVASELVAVDAFLGDERFIATVAGAV